ncbi:MAG: HD domain-containing protein [Lentisphaeria bacterium]
MLTVDSVNLIFDAASIRRWNDQVRPVEFTELDKQAHKMIIAWLLAHSEPQDARQAPDFWEKLIEGGIFELFQRIVLTDIKPHVFHHMMEHNKAEVNAFLKEKLRTIITKIDPALFERFCLYLDDPDYAHLQRQILHAAHYLATNWEFRIIYNFCEGIYGIEKTRREIENQIEDHYNLLGVRKIALGKKTSQLVDLCGQLRFQRRWSQSPRIPETSVLGHMYTVGILAYLCGLELNACQRRLYNDFYGGLFHDLPEVLTRDITSPVKSGVEGLEDTLKAYEKYTMENNLLPLCPAELRSELRYFTEDEFANRIIDRGTIKNNLSVEDINQQFNTDDFSPIDGRIIRVCDHLAAFAEACVSDRYGITSSYLREGRNRLYEKYRRESIAGLNFGPVFEGLNE